MKRILGICLTCIPLITSAILCGSENTESLFFRTGSFVKATVFYPIKSTIELMSLPFLGLKPITDVNVLKNVRAEAEKVGWQGPGATIPPIYALPESFSMGGHCRI